MERCRAEGATRLVLPQGIHHFFPAQAREEYLFISNNDEGLKRIAFFLEGFPELEIDGQGSKLIFHGYILPFVITRSSRVTLRNLTIDWHRAFHSEALVTAVDEDGVDLEIPAEYPHRVEHEKLVFFGEDDARYKITNILEFDSQRRETAFKVRDNYNIGDRHRAYQLPHGRVRFQAQFTEPRPQVGNILAMIDEDRHCPAITISRSDQVLLEDVTLHHAGGMGIIGQLSADVTLRRCKVAPSQGRMVSLRADATHFVCCKGEILLEDCSFSHQLDDPGNFHNVYTPVTERVSDHAVIVKLKHFQQFGLEPYAVGHGVEFLEAASLRKSEDNRLKKVTVINKEYTLLEFENALPAEIGSGWATGSLHWVANVTVRRTRVHSNRARGFLVTSSGTAVFEDNYFHSPGAAILVEGDANYWYEAGAMVDLLVRRNVFDNCNYGVWGRATIEVNPKVSAEYRASQRFHRNLRIEDNEFRTFHPHLLYAHCVDGLTFIGNTVHQTTAYPCEERSEKLAICEHCSNVTVRDNTVATPAKQEALAV